MIRTVSVTFGVLTILLMVLVFAMIYIKGLDWIQQKLAVRRLMRSRRSADPKPEDRR